MSIVFTVTLDYAEWQEEHEQINPNTGKPKKDLFDLLFKIGIDFAKAGISAAIAGAIVAGVGVALSGGAIAAAAAALPVVVVVAGVIVVTVLVTMGVAYIIDLIDKRNESSEKANKHLRELGDYLENKFPNDYKDHGKKLQKAYQEEKHGW